MTVSDRSLPCVIEAPEVRPHRAHPSDAGLDLKSSESLELPPGERALVATGVRIALPPATVGLICPRSGLAAKHGITVVNGPGVIDAGYRGEIKVVLLNTDPHATFQISRGDRIAQLVITPVVSPELIEVADLAEADRGELGFGSTGGFSTTAAKE